MVRFRLGPLVARAACLALAAGLSGCASVALPGVPVRLAAFNGVAGTASESVLALPRFTQTAGGRDGDPVNMMVIATEPTLSAAFQAAGWVHADPIGLDTVARMAQTGLFAGDYPTSPMSALYLFGRIQDYAYQKNAVGILSRDHLRIWRSPGQDALGRSYWAIAATKDVDVKISRGLPTHRIAPDIDTERQLVATDLAATGRVVRQAMIQVLDAPYHGRNGEDDPYVTDGRVAVLELADALLPQ